tara:strand:+ start:332 stop:724 length:393 start_codon:yes stop_codon:yes gene_type:complete
MTELTKEHLQNGMQKRRHKTIDLPGGMTARIQALREGEKAKFEDSLTDKRGNSIARRVRNIRGLLIAQCWVDQLGDRMMSDEDVYADWWQNQDGAFTAVFFKACKSFTGWDDDDFADMEDEVKNCADVQG